KAVRSPLAASQCSITRLSESLFRALHLNLRQPRCHDLCGMMAAITKTPVLGSRRPHSPMPADVCRNLIVKERPDGSECTRVHPPPRPLGVLASGRPFPDLRAREGSESPGHDLPCTHRPRRPLRRPGVL